MRARDIAEFRIGSYILTVDAVRLSELEAHCWSVRIIGERTIFTTRVQREGRSIRCTLERFIAGHVDGLVAVKRIGFDEFDFRSVAIHLLDQMSQTTRLGKKAGNNSSTYKGVWRTKSGRWSASIRPAGASIYLGTYDTEIEAAAAYDKAALAHYGPNAFLNLEQSTADRDVEPNGSEV